MKKSSYFQINSIVKAFALIELLVSRSEVELSELCQQLEFPKTTIHRMLLTLESLGYVRQNPRNLRYAASIKFFELGRKVIEKLNLTEIARPHMIRLSARTGENVNLGVLDGLDVVCIDKVESQHILKQDQPIGARVKAYCAGFGKAILAFLPEEERLRRLSQETLIRYTPNSLKTAKSLEKHLKEVRGRGYAVDNEEGAIGIRCVGAPIFDYEGKAVAGVSIAGPTLRIKEQDVPRLAELITETAATISGEMGSGIRQVV